MVKRIVFFSLIAIASTAFGSTKNTRYSYLNEVQNAIEGSRLDILPTGTQLRIAAFTGLGGNTIVALDYKDANQADGAVAFYLAGLAAHVHSKGDIKSSNALLSRVNNASATNWSSPYILFQDLLRVDPGPLLLKLHAISKNDRLSRLSVVAHRAAAILLARKDRRSAEDFMGSILSSISDPQIGLQVAMEYVYVYKLVQDHEKFSIAFALAQKYFDESGLWPMFLEVVDIVDLITGYETDPDVFLSKLNGIEDAQLRLDALSYGAQSSLANCEQNDFQWFIAQIHEWHLAVSNPLTPEAKLNAVIKTFGEIEAVYIGVWEIVKPRC